MEVPGKREINNFSCKPCEESDVLTQADGFCTNCEEHMCSTCFNAHKKYKLSRDSNNFEKCEQHLNESVKFYCAQHEQVGCGDCMVIGHRSCKVDYILDKAEEIKGTTELESLIKGPEICTTEAKRLLSSIKNNKVQVDDINDKFKQDVNLFCEEITTQINNLREHMLKESECIKDRDSLSMTKLEGETESLISDLNVISDLFKSKVQSPSQLFVCSVSQKPKLDRLMKQLNEIKSRNKIETYEFIKDSKIIRNLASFGQLGRHQEVKDVFDMVDIGYHRYFVKNHAKNILETEGSDFTDHNRVNGYADNGNGDVGLYVDKCAIVNDRYFEIEILSLGRRGTIALGLVPDDYPANNQPGCGKNSIGYHAADGRLYHQSGRGTVFGPKCLVGDTIGCGTYEWEEPRRKTSSCKQGSSRYCVTVVFTRNGEKVGERTIIEGRVNLYPAVGMHSSGEKVEVILDAKRHVV